MDGGDRFDVEKNIREILSDGKDEPPIFDRLLLRFEAYSNRAAANIGEIKRRDNKRAKGDGWERFCQFYLSTVLRYYRVWSWPEVPMEVREFLRLGSRVDNGIDLVAQEKEGGGYTAIQCKYRKKTIQTVTWTTLSTFVGLCAQTGPWLKQVVMTNCKGVSKKTGIQRTYQTMAYGTFKSLTRAQCTLGSLQEQAVGGVEGVGVVVQKPTTAEELRAARLAKFSPPAVNNDTPTDGTSAAK
jgi:hypothetical protein